MIFLTTWNVTWVIVTFSYRWEYLISDNFLSKNYKAEGSGKRRQLRSNFKVYIFLNACYIIIENILRIKKKNPMFLYSSPSLWNGSLLFLRHTMYYTVKLYSHKSAILHILQYFPLYPDYMYILSWNTFKQFFKRPVVLWYTEHSIMLCFPAWSVFPIIIFHIVY